MERRQKIEAVDGEFPLPEAIIQHIQSFLNGKEAAQTTILSKSWYSAWLTRPNLDFEERDFNYNDRRMLPHSFSRNPNSLPFPRFVMKTMQRYEELNLKIESFGLCMGIVELCNPRGSFASEVIVKAMKMGATDFSFVLRPYTGPFVLPDEVLGSKTLIRLSVTQCYLNCRADVGVSCSGLKSLILSYVYVEGDLIWEIVSSCPLIEKLTLSECRWIFKVPTFNVLTGRMSTSLPLHLSPFFEFGKQKEGSVVDGPINLYGFHWLTCLLLKGVNIDTLFFQYFYSMFPCLKDLTIHDCVGYKGITLCSPSLVCIDFAQTSMLRAKFDVPSIRKFTFSGSLFPSLSFKTPTRGLESEISITCKYLTTLWFSKLNKFLTKLSSSSKISLYLNFWSHKGFGCVGHFEGLPKVEVENLTFDASSSVCAALFEGLFNSCRPKFITQCWFPETIYPGKFNNDFLEVLYDILMQQVYENCCDLEGFNVEVFEETVAMWQPLPWKLVLDASKNLDDKRKIRFLLKWRLEYPTVK